MIEFAVPHTLAFSFFPHWLMDLRQTFGAVKTRLTALNVHDAVLRLTEGGCDLLIAYHHAEPAAAAEPRALRDAASSPARRWRPTPRPGPTASRCSACPGGRAGACPS